MRLSGLLFVWVFCSTDWAQLMPQPDPLLIIVGSKHYGNKMLSHEDLYHKLVSLNPDVILWENDSDFKKVFGVQTAAALRLGKVSIEQRALQRFAKKFPGIPIMGFDTAFARKATVKEIVDKGGRLYDSMYTAYHLGRMSALDSVTFERYLTAQQYFLETILEGPLDSMNSNPWLEKLTLYFALDEAIHCHMATRYVQDTTLLRWYARDNQFWMGRNNAMVRRIQEHRLQYPGKRVVVLTGLAHKPELLRLMDMKNHYPVMLR